MLYHWYICPLIFNVIKKILLETIVVGSWLSIRFPLMLPLLLCCTLLNRELLSHFPFSLYFNVVLEYNFIFAGPHQWRISGVWGMESKSKYADAISGERTGVETLPFISFPSTPSYCSFFLCRLHRFFILGGEAFAVIDF